MSDKETMTTTQEEVLAAAREFRTVANLHLAATIARSEAENRLNDAERELGDLRDKVEKARTAMYFAGLNMADAERVA